jgi:hypothetical protein
MGKEDERIPFASRIRFRNEEGVHELRGIRYKMFEFVMDGVEGKHCIFADIGMAVLET